MNRYKQQNLPVDDNKYTNMVSRAGVRFVNKLFQQSAILFAGKEIVEYRTNGVVTLEGGNYLFNAFADTDFKNWRIGFITNINNQFAGV